MNRYGAVQKVLRVFSFTLLNLGGVFLFVCVLRIFLHSLYPVVFRMAVTFHTSCAPLPWPESSETAYERWPKCIH